MDDKIFTSELNKPELNEETLAHYGVLGMKWGVRKNPEKAFAKAAKKSDKYAKKIYKTNKKYLKEAKKVSRFFGRKRAQNKVVRLNAKKDYLTSKKDKWDNKIEEVFDKEVKKNYLNTKNDLDARLDKIEKLDKAYLNAFNKVPKSRMDNYKSSRWQKKYANDNRIINMDASKKTKNKDEKKAYDFYANEYKKDADIAQKKINTFTKTYGDPGYSYFSKEDAKLLKDGEKYIDSRLKKKKKTSK